MTKDNLKDIIQWDISSWRKALEYWENEVDWSQVNHALEVGGREGGLSFWLANKGIQTVCSDLENVQSSAEKLHIKHGIQDKIIYQDIDATSIPYENYFDVIVFKSILGGVGRNGQKAKQKEAIAQMYKALKPGGTLLFAENLVSSPIHQFMRKKFLKWGNQWRYVTQEEMIEFLEPFSKKDLHTTGVTATFGRTETQRKLLTKLDNSLINYISPESWKYIIYGRAIK